MSILKKIRKSDNLKSVVAIAIVVVIVLGFFIGLRVALNTDVPVRVVESGSMCVPYDGLCNGWSHPFDQTLHVGDIIIIQAINPQDLNTDYPNSDIIVYQNPANPTATPIVHRIAAVENINGTLYFQTKGDGNGQKWPATPSPQEYDSNTLWTTRQGVPENLVIGKVVMRIPWFGFVTLFLRSNQWGLPVIISLILLLIVFEFILPIVRQKKKTAVQQETQQNQSTNPFI